MATADAQKAAGNCTIYNLTPPEVLPFLLHQSYQGLPGHLSSINVI